MTAQVSVLIPTYNRATLLNETLDSVLSQDVDLEVIVFDNLSSDDTVERVRNRGDRRLSVITTDTNIGPVANMAKAMDGGSASILTVFHDDDLMRSNNLATKLDFLAGEPQVGLVYSSYEVIDEHSGTLRASYRAPGPVDRVEPGRLFVERCFAGMERVHMCTAVVRRSALEGLRPHPGDGTHNDYGLYLRVAQRCDIGFVDQPLVAIRIHRSTWSFDAGLTLTSETGELRSNPFAGLDARLIAARRFVDELEGDEAVMARRRMRGGYRSSALMAAKVALRNGRPGDAMLGARRVAKSFVA